MNFVIEDVQSVGALMTTAEVENSRRWLAKTSAPPRRGTHRNILL